MDDEEGDFTKVLMIYMMTNLSRGRLLQLMIQYPKQMGLDDGNYYKDGEYYVPGRIYIDSCLECPNPQRMKDNIGIYPVTFYYILDALHVGFENMRNSDVSHKEMIAIFLNITICGGGFRGAANLFQRSKSTVHNSFHIIAKLIFAYLYDVHVVWPAVNCERHPILMDNRYSPFGNCVGGGDGTYIKLIVPSSISGRMRCRKGYTCMNVFAVANFNCEFIFVQAGGDGAEHDATILRYIEQKNQWPLIGNQTILLDAAYGNSSHKFTPYRSVRYHLREWRHADNRPNSAMELYNLRHSKLRSQAIECAFGILKEKFRIFQQPLEFQRPMIQMMVIYDLFCLHNIILQYEGKPTHINDVENIDADNFIHDLDMNTISGNDLRDEVAGEMWYNYQLYLNHS